MHTTHPAASRGTPIPATSSAITPGVAKNAIAVETSAPMHSARTSTNRQRPTRTLIGGPGRRLAPRGDFLGSARSFFGSLVTPSSASFDLAGGST